MSLCILSSSFLHLASRLGYFTSVPIDGGGVDSNGFGDMSINTTSGAKLFCAVTWIGPEFAIVQG